MWFVHITRFGGRKKEQEVDIRRGGKKVLRSGHGVFWKFNWGS